MSKDSIIRFRCERRLKRALCVLAGSRGHETLAREVVGRFVSAADSNMTIPIPLRLSSRLKKLADKTQVAPETLALHCLLEYLPQLEKDNGIRRPHKPKL